MSSSSSADLAQLTKKSLGILIGKSLSLIDQGDKWSSVPHAVCMRGRHHHTVCQDVIYSHAGRQQNFFVGGSEGKREVIADFEQ